MFIIGTLWAPFGPSSNPCSVGSHHVPTMCSFLQFALNRQTSNLGTSSRTTQPQCAVSCSVNRARLSADPPAAWSALWAVETPDAKQINDGSCLARRTLLLENQVFHHNILRATNHHPSPPILPVSQAERENRQQTKAGTEKSGSQWWREKFRLSNCHHNVPSQPVTFKWVLKTFYSCLIVLFVHNWNLNIRLESVV